MHTALLTAAARAQDPPPSEELLQHRADLIRTHRALKIGTAAALGVTTTLGVIAAVNQPTLFGDGACAAGRPVLGSYGCSGFSILHGSAGVATELIYTANMAVALAVPPVAGVRPLGPFDHGPVHRASTWVHVGAMLLQPVLGIVASNPQMIGVGPGSQANFSRNLRTVHIVVGLAGTGAHWTTLGIEFF